MKLTVKKSNVPSLKVGQKVQLTSIGMRTDAICIFNDKDFHQEFELEGARATFNSAIGPRADQVNITLTGFYQSNPLSWKHAEIVLE